MSTALGEVGLTPADAETFSAADLVSFALERFSPKIAIASSFGAEDIVLIHLAAQARQGFRVFTLDTDFLFRETYGLIDKIERRYQIKVERTRPRLSPKEQAAAFGEALWSRQPDQCCNLRKVEPLTRKLSELDAWVTGIRRDQAPTRAHARKLEWDARFGLSNSTPWPTGNGNRCGTTSGRTTYRTILSTTGVIPASAAPTARVRCRQAKICGQGGGPVSRRPNAGCTWRSRPRAAWRRSADLADLKVSATP